MIDGMEDMVFDRLEAWCKNPKNKVTDPMKPGQVKKRVPTMITFYRDGLSETQFEECRTKEILAVRNAFARIASKYDPAATLKLTFVVAGKRHHTRFFPKTMADTFSNEEG
jgi:hypothetical protein